MFLLDFCLIKSVPLDSSIEVDISANMIYKLFSPFFTTLFSTSFITSWYDFKISLLFWRLIFIM